jgi:hypothetical protein
MDVYNTNPTFKMTMDTKDHKGLHQGIVGVGNQLPRLTFITKLVQQMIVLKEFTPKGYTEWRPEDLDNIGQDLLDNMKRDHIDATISAMTSNCHENDVMAFKITMWVSKTNLLEYVFWVLDHLVAHGEKDGGNNQAPDAMPSRDNDGQMAVQMSTLLKEMAKMNTTLLQLITRSDIKDGIGQQLDSATWKAIFFKTPKDHDCGYHIMQGLADGIASPTKPLVMTTANAQEDKATILVKANQLFDNDQA